MKKLLLLTGIILIACVLAGSLAAPSVSDMTVVEATTAAAKASVRGYVVRDCDGKIAVFRKGEAAPMMTTATRTESLPRADAQKLRRGIEAGSKQEVERILEDFCS